MRIAKDISYVAASFKNLFSGKKFKRGYYWGWVGHGNLGDTALQKAIYGLFKNGVHFHDNPKGQILRGLEKIGRLQFDVLMLGGGTFIFEHDDELEKITRSDVGKKIIFGSGVADPKFIDQEIGRRVDYKGWLKALNEMDYIGVRGPLSKNILTDFGVKKEIHVTGDPALMFAKKISGVKLKRKRLGLNFGTTKGLIWGKNEEVLLNKFSEFISIMLREGWEMEMMPVWKEDLPVIDRVLELAQAKDHVKVFGDYGSVENYVERAGSFDVFIGLKLHSVIFSYCANTPAVMIEYRPKCLDFMKSIHMENFNIRADQFEVQQAKNLIDLLYNDVESIRKKTNAACLDYQFILKQEADAVMNILNEN